MIQRSTVLQLVLVGLVSTTGCDPGPTRLPVEGTVTLDGQPIKIGQINFVPFPDTSSPTAGAPIINGRFSIASSGGPLVGKFRAEITSAQASGRKQSTLNRVTGQMELVDVPVQLVPSRYNRESELTVDVTSSGPNRFEFALTTRK